VRRKTTNVDVVVEVKVDGVAGYASAASLRRPIHTTLTSIARNINSRLRLSLSASMYHQDAYITHAGLVLDLVCNRTDHSDPVLSLTSCKTHPCFHPSSSLGQTHSQDFFSGDKTSKAFRVDVGGFSPPRNFGAT